jgi:hypothetical protein
LSHNVEQHHSKLSPKTTVIVIVPFHGNFYFNQFSENLDSFSLIQNTIFLAELHNLNKLSPSGLIEHDFLPRFILNDSE